jgi:hypothetical protein
MHLECILFMKKGGVCMCMDGKLTIKLEVIIIPWAVVFVAYCIG